MNKITSKKPMLETLEKVMRNNGGWLDLSGDTFAEFIKKNTEEEK